MHSVFALSLQGTLKDIGALAGLVAIPGVAVLALLYFAQAREVKRLREWAGRAPERAAELQGRAVGPTTAARFPPVQPVQPVRRVTPQPAPQPASRPATGAQPAPQPASRPPTGAQPAPAAQTPAGSAPGNTGGQPPPGAARPATPAAGGGPGVLPKPPSPAASGTQPPAAASRAAGSPIAAPPVTAPPRPVGAAAPVRPAPSNDRPRSPDMAGGSAAAATSPPSTGARPAAAAPLRASAPGATMPPRQPPGRQGLFGRMGRGAAAAVSAVILVLVIGGVFLLTQSGGGKSSSKSSASAPVQASTGEPTKESGQPAAPASRGQTTVSVLNGTTTPGLASTISDQLQRGGFKRGSVTNAADQQRPETLVNYAPGFKRAADEIARLLKLKTVQPIDPGTQAIAGPNAQVVVTVGTDRTQ